MIYSKLGGCLGETAKLAPLARTDLWAEVKGLLDKLMMHLGLGSSLENPWGSLLRMVGVGFPSWELVLSAWEVVLFSWEAWGALCLVEHLKPCLPDLAWLPTWPAWELPLPSPREGWAVAWEELLPSLGGRWAAAWEVLLPSLGGRWAVAWEELPASLGGRWAVTWEVLLSSLGGRWAVAWEELLPSPGGRWAVAWGEELLPSPERRWAPKPAWEAHGPSPFKGERRGLAGGVLLPSPEGRWVPACLLATRLLSAWGELLLETLVIFPSFLLTTIIGNNMERGAQFS